MGHFEGKHTLLMFSRCCRFSAQLTLSTLTRVFILHFIISEFHDISHQNTKKAGSSLCIKRKVIHFIKSSL